MGTVHGNGTVAGKNVLVTGGSGSIGSELVRRLLIHDPQSVRVFDNNEQALFNLQQELDADNLRFLLGDVRDRDRLEMTIENIDVVFHAAALKHVEINEYNPFEAIQTNIQGTQNLIRMALEEEVSSLVGISTDKAAHPTSVMGATKILSERLITAANTYKGGKQTDFSCVRFGNVLGFSGSVVPVFLNQIKDGGPVTVTGPSMTRFIMPVEEAVDLVLEAHDRMHGGEVFVLKMPAFRVGTLAEAMRDEYAPTFGNDQDEVPIERVGRRPGERLHEKLVSLEETRQTREHKKMFVIYPQIDIPGYTEVDDAAENSLSGEYTFADTELLSKSELLEQIAETKTLSFQQPDHD